jgi:hypothetical protein
MGITKYFVDYSGSYLGGFDGAEPPDRAIEVATAPDDARQVWNRPSISSNPKPSQGTDTIAYDSTMCKAHHGLGWITSGNSRP